MRLTLRLLALLMLSTPLAAADGLTFEQLSAIREVAGAEISPDGRHVAYVLNVPRRPGVDDDGPAWRELHVARLADGRSRPYVFGEVNVSGVRFSPDGRYLTYLAKRGGDEERSLWAIPVDGGESRKVLEFDEAIRDYGLSPAGDRVALIADDPETEERTEAVKKGYKQKVFEEDWRARRVWIGPISLEPPAANAPGAEEAEQDDAPQPLAIEGSVFNLAWSADGRRLALAVAPRPLIDDQLMARRIHIVDAASGEVQVRLNNPGKLGDFAFAPDGRHLALITAADPNDPSAGRLMLASTRDGTLRDLLADLDGHVRDFAWQDAETVMFLAAVGVGARFGEVDIGSGAVKSHLESDPAAGRPHPLSFELSADGRHAALVADAPTHPAELFVLSHGEPAPRRLTDSNPWLSDVALAPQEVVRIEARDGLLLEGILLRPLRPLHGDPAPLLLMVHGGPEGHDRNGWVTNYSRPGQLAAGRGYAVLYPNYRGSTGRGVAFSKLGQADAAGKEFDDLVDAVDLLVERGIADTDRVGVAGGSYGGYATAWCATRFTERFRAGVMFVGISNKISKGLTTEIPVEDRMVHTLADPWTDWQLGLERSPIYHAQGSRTALLIAGGEDDTRVHPSQSLQLYRALRLLGKTPVRLVRYPGEGHGNRRAAARDDYTRRLIRWMDHFLLADHDSPPPRDLELPRSEDADGEGDAD